MKSNNLHWFSLKTEWQKELSEIYGEHEASSILTILGEELLPHYSKLSFKDKSFEIKSEELHVIEAGISRLKLQEPLQYILGKAWFYDLVLKVNPSVLIPRPETEELVSWILENKELAKSILDIGTGSGCIPLTIKKHAPQLQVHALDIDANAIKLAKENAVALDLEVSFQECNILDKTQWQELGKFDIIVSNPPYIPTKEKALMQDNVIAFEPHLALFVENDDALIFYKEIASFAESHLNKNGLLFFECNEYNAKNVADMLDAMSFHEIEIRQDLQGKDRMIKCKLKT